MEKSREEIKIWNEMESFECALPYKGSKEYDVGETTVNQQTDNLHSTRLSVDDLGFINFDKRKFILNIKGVAGETIDLPHVPRPGIFGTIFFSSNEWMNAKESFLNSKKIERATRKGDDGSSLVF